MSRPLKHGLTPKTCQCMIFTVHSRGAKTQVCLAVEGICEAFVRSHTGTPFMDRAKNMLWNRNIREPRFRCTDMSRMFRY